MLKPLTIMVLFLELFMFGCDKAEPEPDKPQGQVSLNQEKSEPKKLQQPKKSESKKPTQEELQPKKDPGPGTNKNTSEAVSRAALLGDAIKNGDVAKAKDLISSKKIDLNGKDSYGYPPLNYAALYGHKEIVDDLLMHNAKVDEAGPFNLTALHYAAFLGHKDIAESLIKKGANVNALDNYKNTPLHFAYFRGHDDLKGLLVANGADKNAKNKIPELPKAEPQAPKKVLIELTSAILYADDAALVAALIERHSLDINAPIEEIGGTPLQFALTFGRPVIFKFLKGKGADFSKISQQDVFDSMSRFDAQIFAELLDATGTKATAADKKGTLLRRAHDSGKTELFELLIDRGADKNEKDKEGSTFLDQLAHMPSHFFDANYDHFKMLKTLLKRNAEVKDDQNLRDLQVTIVKYTMGDKLVDKAHVPTDLVKEVFDLVKKRVGIDFSHIDKWKDDLQVKKALEDLQA